MKTTISTLILGLALSLASHAGVYIKFDGIDGEATDNDHSDWIIIESMSLPVFRAKTDPAGQTQTKPNGSPATSRNGTPTLGDVVVVRELDKSSTKLMESCLTGSPFSSATVRFETSKPDGSTAYLTYKLKDVIVTSYSTSSSGERPSESFSLNYTEVEWTYSTVSPDGTSNPSQTYNWNAGTGTR